MFHKVVGILFKLVAKNDIDFVIHVVLFGLGTDKSLGFLSLLIYSFSFSDIFLLLTKKFCITNNVKNATAHHL